MTQQQTLHHQPKHWGIENTGLTQGVPIPKDARLPIPSSKHDQNKRFRLDRKHLKVMAIEYQF